MEAFSRDVILHVIHHSIGTSSGTALSIAISPWVSWLRSSRSSRSSFSIEKRGPAVLQRSAWTPSRFGKMAENKDLKLLVGFDLTISVANSTEDFNQVILALKQVFRELVFQREKSDSGYDHWQCRGWVRGRFLYSLGIIA